MIDFSKLLLFLFTFFLVSITPGMCMSLAMTLGMRVGYRKTLFMMIGEMFGVAVVCVSVIYGVAVFLIENHTTFLILKLVGGCYLIFLGVQLYFSRPEINETTLVNLYKPSQLFAQGFVTAVSNPKGWAFMISLLPPFIDSYKPLAPQLTVLIVIILISEFIAMSLYAIGGKKLASILTHSNRIHLLNKIAGALLCIVGLWLFVS